MTGLVLACALFAHAAVTLQRSRTGADAPPRLAAPGATVPGVAALAVG